MAITALARVGNAIGTLTATTTAPQYLVRFNVIKRSLGTKRRLRALVDGTISTGAAVLLSMTITVSLGTETVTVLTGFTLALGLSNRLYKIIVTITADDVANSQSISVDFYETVTNQSVFTIRPYQGKFSQPVDTTDCEFSIKVAFSGITSGAAMTRHMAVMELVG